MSLTIAERNELRRQRLLQVPVYLPAERQNIDVPNLGVGRAKQRAIEELLFNIWNDIKRRPRRDRVFRVRINQNGVFKSKKINYTGMDQYQVFRRFFFADGSDADNFPLRQGDRIEIRFAKKLNPKYKRQLFREGVTHCVIEPIKQLWLRSRPNSESQKRLKNQVLRNCDELYMLWKNDGIPESHFEAIGEVLHTSITLRTALGTSSRTYNKDASKTIIFENRSFNHVEQVPVKRPSRTITHEQALRMIVSEPDIVWTGLPTDPIRIITPQEILVVNNPLIPYYEEIYSLLPKNIGLYASKYPAVNKFIRAGTVVHSAPMILDRFKFIETDFGLEEEYVHVEEEYIQFDGHLDLASAYAQFDKTPYYKGFPAKAQQSRTFNHSNIDVIKEHIGIYQVRVVETTEFSELCTLYKGTYVLPSPEILFWADEGVVFHTIAGVLFSKFDFRFPASSFEIVKDRMGKERKPYQMVSGIFSAAKDEHDIKEFNVKGDTEFGQHIASEFEHPVYHMKEDVVVDGVSHKVRVISLHKPAEHVFTQHHVLAFITSYTRIVMLTEMKKFQPSQLVEVKLDGLFYRGTPPTNLIPEFREKAGTIAESHTPWYTPHSDTYDFPPPYIMTSTAFLGSGGSGKTHEFLTDKGFIDVVYASPTHKLGEEKQDAYNVRYNTFHRLAGIGCDAVDPPAVVFVDEATQLDKRDIERFIKKSPHTLIVIAGDIDEHGNHYQTKYQNEIWKPTLPIKWFTKDYRAINCPILQQMKLDIRAKMRELYAEQHPYPAYAMRDFVQTRFPTYCITPAQSYHMHGTFIAGTHRHIAELKCNILPNNTIRTTHAVQGMTITESIIISLNDMFELTMAYTAMSRAVSHTQVYFVCEN
jgi:hypothetical protein